MTINLNAWGMSGYFGEAGEPARIFVVVTLYDNEGAAVEGLTPENFDVHYVRRGSMHIRDATIATAGDFTEPRAGIYQFTVETSEGDSSDTVAAAIVQVSTFEKSSKLGAPGPVRNQKVRIVIPRA